MKRALKPFSKSFTETCENIMIKFPPIINHAYIMVTEQCPNDCVYCYIKDRRTPNEFNYDWVEIIKKSFTCMNKPRIIFFGGEPLLKIDLIKRIVENYKDDFQFQVVTNGLVNLHRFVEEVFKPYRKHFDVQVSWDGNDNTRVMHSGKISNTIVYDNIIKELENGAVFEGRCVLSDASVGHFYDTYKTFKKLHSQYDFSGDFTIAHQLSFGESYPIVLKEQLQMIYNDIRNDLGKSFFAPRFILKTLTNVLQNRSVISCDIGTHVVIKPNGDIYPCTILSQTAPQFRLGNITDKVDTDIITKLRTPSPCQRDCKFKNVCDGGCRYERIKLFPKTWDCDICNHTCGIYQSIYEATVEFLNGLSNSEMKILQNYLNEYNMWSIDYNDCINDNTKRLFEE